MTRGTSHGRLDDHVSAVQAALAQAGVPAPDVLLFPATGAASLQGTLTDAVSIRLGDMDGTPVSHAESTLYAGEIGPQQVWLIEDAPLQVGCDAPAWAAAFPIWLAAQAGGQVLVHLSAGTALKSADVGSIARLTDHINLSGTTPLFGLGESRLGPLFPDQTRLHDRALGQCAADCAHGLGIGLVPAVAACTLGPALSTPAELRSYAAAGADVAVQRLSDPLIAAAHAGLVALGLAALTDTVGEVLDVAELVERAAATAPHLEALAMATIRELAPIVQTRREEAGA